MVSVAALVKTVVVGRPKTTAHLEHERLTKKLALAVFSSDALSSSAYATEEMLHVLILGGAAALTLSVPLAIGVVVVLGIVITSYRQTVHAYPQGGGSYIVARENLGKWPGLTAAGSILIGYVLTVAVSISAGVAALVAAVPEAHGFRVAIAVSVVVIMTFLNLRGIKESGQIFAVPTYGFIALIGLTIAWGLIRYFVFGYRPTGSVMPAAMQSVNALLLLTAFSRGCTALTGVEAIADGVGAFRKPEAKNAASTLTALALILGVLFIGLTVLARLYAVWAPDAEHNRTVVAVVAFRVFGAGNPLFYLVQAATALILFLGANTAYADFPRLSAILARDRFAPSQMMNRGDRLAYSNGIIGLSSLAALLIVIYSAEVTRLLSLYVVGVFAAFTLSQAGMVQRWREYRATERSWRRNAVINGIGALTTLFVGSIVLVTRFLEGAWMVVVAVPLLAQWFNVTNRHYRSVARTLRDPARRVMRAARHHVVLLIGWPSEEESRALAYAQLLQPEQLHCVHFAKPDELKGLVQAWGHVLASANSLEVVPARNGLARDVQSYVAHLRRRTDPAEFLTVVVPEVIRPGLLGMVSSRDTLMAKAALLFTPDVVVTDVPTHAGLKGFADVANARHVVVVMVSAVHNATMQALQYARSLRATEVHSIHVTIEPADRARVINEWYAWAADTPLEILDSPYRELARPVQDYVREFTADGSTIVTVLIPEFIVQKWWHHLLHNQRALLLKRTLLYEPNVVVTSVTYSIS